MRAQTFRIKAGGTLLTEYEMSPGVFRAFCSTYGSPIYARLATEPEFMRIRLGTLNDDPRIEPVAHVWVSSKAPWFEISDALPRFARSASDG